MLRIKKLNISFEKPLFIDQSLEIKNNCLTLIVGESGCGKTTLLYKLGLIDLKKEDCLYYIDNENISTFSPKKKTILRRYDIAFVFQDYILYDHFNVYENIQYYASLVGHHLSKEKVLEYLRKVHLDIPLDRRLYTLSGGQKQRLAIACALTKETPILILDEPTSALDTENVKIIFQILEELKKEKTIIMTSHNMKAKEYCDEIIEIKGGNITKIKTKEMKDEALNIVIKKAHLPLRTYVDYIKKQFAFSKKIKSLIIFVNMFIILFCIGITQVTNNFIQQSQSIISKDNPGWLYVPSIQEDNLHQMNIKNYYPFYDVSLIVLGETYPVIPYYDEININDKIWTKFDLSQEQGFYFSHSLFYKNSHLIVPTQYIQFMKYPDFYKIPLLYKGILLKGIETEYIDSKEYIYMNNQLIEEKLKPTKVLGYTLFCYSYEQLTDIKNTLESKEFKVIPYSEYDDVVQYVELLNNIQQIVTICIVLLGIITLYFLYRSYFQTREKEFALLKCMGLTNMNISTLVFFESCFINILSLIIIIFGIIWFIDYSILDLCFIEMIILLSIFMIVGLMVIRLRPTNILRNK